MTRTPLPFDQPRDRLLRSRVRLFGNLLGEVLREQAGEGVLFAVETLRKGYIRLRTQENPALRKRLSRLIEGLQPNEVTYVIRAFNIYFSSTRKSSKCACVADIFVLTLGVDCSAG